MIDPGSNNAAVAALNGMAKAAADFAHHAAALASAYAIGAAPDTDRSSLYAPGLKPRPTREQCSDPQNKIGVNLSPRGVEIIYRLFDHGSSVRAASIALGISHRAAKWRKGAWQKAGGQNRPRTVLDIDY